jgi:hypothetical protein
LIDGMIALFHVANENALLVPLAQPMPPVVELPLPMVCGPAIVIVQLSVGMVIVIVQPGGIVTV